MKDALIEESDIKPNEIQVARDAATLMDDIIEVIVKDLTNQLWQALPRGKIRLTARFIKSKMNDLNFRRYWFNRVDFSDCVGNQPVKSVFKSTDNFGKQYVKHPIEKYASGRLP